MATLYSNQYKGTAPIVEKEMHAGAFQVTAVFTLAAALALNDVIKMVPVRAGLRVKDLYIASTDVDTDVSPAILFDVGDSDGTPDPDRYIDGSDIGQAGGMARMAALAGVNYQFAADGSIDILVAVGPGTGATSGTITMVALLAADDMP